MNPSAVFAAFALAVALSPAASDPEVLVLPLQTEGKIDARLRKTLQTRLEEGVSGGRAQACDEPCDPASVAREQEAYVVQASVVRRGRDYAIEAQLYEPGQGSVVVETDASCEICGVSAVLGRIDDVASRLAEKLELMESATTTLSVNARPEGAVVRCEGGLAGETPVEFSVKPGPLSCVVEAEGYESASLDFQLVAGTSERASVALAKAFVPLPEPKPNRPKRIAGWTTAGVGAASIAASIPLFVLHHRPRRSRCTGNDIDINGRCRYRYVTLTPAAVTASIGVVALATGVGLLVSERRARMGTLSAITSPTELGVQWTYAF